MTSDERKKLLEDLDWCTRVEFQRHGNRDGSVSVRWADPAALKAELSRPEGPPAWTLERQAALSKRLKEWFPHYRDAMELIRDAAADIGRDFCKQAEAPLPEEVREIEKRVQAAALPPKWDDDHAGEDIVSRSAWEMACADRATLLRFIKSSPPRLTEEDERIMGTLGEARSALLEKWRVYTSLSCPLIADRKTHKERDAQCREAEVRLREAACLVAWHLDRLSQGEAPPLAHKKSAGNCEHNRAVDAARAQGEAPPAVTVEELRRAITLCAERLLGVTPTMSQEREFAKAIAALLRKRGYRVGGE